MKIKDLHKDLESGAVRRKIAYLMRLKTSFPLAVEVVAREYEVTPEQMREVCKREFNKYRKEVITIPEEKQKRQRTTDHRNQLIKFRFYDLHEKERLRVDDVIKRLAEEFYLSEIRIVEIIRGAISTGEIPITQSSIIKAFNKPTRADNRNKQINNIVQKLKKEYGQKAN